MNTAVGFGNPNDGSIIISQLSLKIVLEYFGIRVQGLLDIVLS